MRRFVCDLCGKEIGDGEPVYVISIKACYSNGLHHQKISSADYCYACQLMAIGGDYGRKTPRQDCSVAGKLASETCKENSKDGKRP